MSEGLGLVIVIMLMFVVALLGMILDELKWMHKHLAVSDTVSPDTPDDTPTDRK